MSNNPRPCWFKVRRNDDWRCGKLHAFMQDSNPDGGGMPVALVEGDDLQMYAVYAEYVNFASVPPVGVDK